MIDRSAHAVDRHEFRSQWRRFWRSYFIIFGAHFKPCDIVNVATTYVVVRRLYSQPPAPCLIVHAASGRARRIHRLRRILSWFSHEVLVISYNNTLVNVISITPRLVL